MAYSPPWYHPEHKQRTTFFHLLLGITLNTSREQYLFTPLLARYQTEHKQRTSAVQFPPRYQTEHKQRTTTFQFPPRYHTEHKQYIGNKNRVQRKLLDAKRTGYWIIYTSANEEKHGENVGI